MSYKRYSNHLFEFAEIMLFALDVPPHLQGFLFLAEAVAIRAKDKRSRFKAIYARIAATYGISRKTVSSAMSYAIFYSPDVLRHLAHHSRRTVYRQGHFVPCPLYKLFRARSH